MRMCADHGPHACVRNDLVVRCQFANFCVLAQTLRSHPRLPRSSYPTLRVRSVSTSAPSCLALATPVGRSELFCRQPSLTPRTTTPPVSRSHPILVSLPVFPTMTSEGDPITGDSFTPRQLELIRELIVVNRPLPSAFSGGIKMWLECYARMASVLVTRFPEKAPELWAYQSTILKAAHNYEG